MSPGSGQPARMSRRRGHSALCGSLGGVGLRPGRRRWLRPATAQQPRMEAIGSVNIMRRIHNQRPYEKAGLSRGAGSGIGRVCQLPTPARPRPPAGVSGFQAAAVCASAAADCRRDARARVTGGVFNGMPRAAASAGTLAGVAAPAAGALFKRGGDLAVLRQDQQSAVSRPAGASEFKQRRREFG